MNAGKFLPWNVMLVVVSMAFVACGAKPTPIPQKDFEIKNVTENKEVTGEISQVKLFDQCAAAGSVQAQIQFSRSSTESSQRELVLGASAGGEAGISAAAKVQVQASIEQHFSSVNTTAEDYREAISIEIPAHARQEYTITWREIRREGTVEYIENGETQTTDYSYRIGLEFVSSVAKNVSCEGALAPEPTSSSTPTASPSPTITPLVVKTIEDGCVFSKTWLANALDPNVLSSVSTEADGCYDMGTTGIFADRSGVLHLLERDKKILHASGIYTPIANNAIIEFKVFVKSMYIAPTGIPTYVSFAIAPADDPTTPKNSARFKLQMEDYAGKRLIYFVLADVDENNGARLTDQHYEYQRSYIIRFELTGSIMSIFINNIKLNENLAIPGGSKVFYMSYNVPAYTGVDVEVTNIKIDGLPR